MKRLVGLATKSCKGSNLAALDQAGADKLRGQTPGWRLIEAETGQLSIRQEWKVRSAENWPCGSAVFVVCSAFRVITFTQQQTSLSRACLKLKATVLITGM